MEVLIDRKYKKSNYTIGDVYINGEWYCNSLEDTVRDGGIKIPTETAIPGNGHTINGIKAPDHYSILWTYSPKFKRNMPLVFPVPCFEGIRIHKGKNERYSAGCILFGLNTIKGQLTKSEEICEDFYKLVKDCSDRGEKIILTIK